MTLTGSTKPSETDPTLKTRHFADIVQEITRSLEIHRERGTTLGGVHLELTGEVNTDGFSVVSGRSGDADRRLNVLAVRWSSRTNICPSITALIVTQDSITSSLWILHS